LGENLAYTITCPVEGCQKVYQDNNGKTREQVEQGFRLHLVRDHKLRGEALKKAYEEAKRTDGAKEVSRFEVFKGELEAQSRHTRLKEKLEHAREMKKKAETRLKRAKNALRKWTKKEKYYKKQLSFG